MKVLANDHDALEAPGETPMPGASSAFGTTSVSPVDMSDLGRQVKVKDHFKGGDLSISYVQPSDGFAIPKSQFASLLTPLPAGFSASTVPTSSDSQLQRLVEAMASFDPSAVGALDTSLASDPLHASLLAAPVNDPAVLRDRRLA